MEEELKEMRREYRDREDPSALTTAQLHRELNNLRESILTRLEAMDKAMTLFQDNLTRVPTDTDKQIGNLKNAVDIRISGMDKAIELLRQEGEKNLTSIVQTIEMRLSGMDKAVELLHDDLTRSPTESDRHISHLNDLYNEKFNSIQKQFEERDVRTEQAAIATKIAVDAALQAQKEAAGAQNESNSAAITKSEAATVKQIDGITALLNSSTSALNDKIADVKGRMDRGEGSTQGVSANVSTNQASSGNMINMVIAFAAIIAIGVSMFAVTRPTSPPQPVYQATPPTYQAAPVIK